MSASRSPTSAPLLRSAAARLTATVDLPTPPLPEATAMVCLTPGRISDGLGREKAGRTLAVIRTSTPVTPASAPTASSACVLKRSRTGQAGVVSSKVKLTFPSRLTSSSLIMPRLTTSRPRSGSLMVDSTWRTCCEDGLVIRDRMLPRLLTSLRQVTISARMKTKGSPRNHGEASEFAGSRQVTAESSPSELIAYYGGAASDVYFQRARKTLDAAHVDAVVAMDFFAGTSGILCGVAEAVRLLGGILRDGDEAYALPEGAPMSATETVLRVRAPYSHFGVYETALLGMLSSCSGWATAAREIVDAANGKRVISFGARHVHPLIAPTMEYSAVVGGCAGCATPLGAQMAGLQGASGTMPHAMMLLFGDTVKAALAFDKHMGDDVLRIVLVDTFKDEAEESLRVAEALGQRLRGVRLDTPGERGGVTVDLVKEVRARLDQAGYDHVGIFISGGLDAGRIREFEAEKS